MFTRLHCSTCASTCHMMRKYNRWVLEGGVCGGGGEANCYLPAGGSGSGNESVVCSSRQ